MLMVKIKNVINNRIHLGCKPICFDDEENGTTERLERGVHPLHDRQLEL